MGRSTNEDIRKNFELTPNKKNCKCIIEDGGICNKIVKKATVSHMKQHIQTNHKNVQFHIGMINEMIPKDSERYECLMKHLMKLSIASGQGFRRIYEELPISTPNYSGIQKYKIESFTLSLCPIEAPHTSSVIKQKIISLMDQHNIESDKISKFVTDGGSNMRKAFKLQEFESGRISKNEFHSEYSEVNQETQRTPSQRSPSQRLRDKSVLLVICRYLSAKNEIKEEPLIAEELKERTTGGHVADIVINFFKENHSLGAKVRYICTDGAPSMIGRINGAVEIMKQPA
ncbi:hypothetical protein SNEBB_002938, partial [Seison nebaliae]